MVIYQKLFNMAARANIVFLLKLGESSCQKHLSQLNLYIVIMTKWVVELSADWTLEMSTMTLHNLILDHMRNVKFKTSSPQL